MQQLLLGLPNSQDEHSLLGLRLVPSALITFSGESQFDCQCDTGYRVENNACVRSATSATSTSYNVRPTPTSRRRSSSYSPSPLSCTGSGCVGMGASAHYSPPPPPSPTSSVSDLTLVIFVIGVLSALCKFGKCLLSGFKKLFTDKRRTVAQDEIIPDNELHTHNRRPGVDTDTSPAVQGLNSAVSHYDPAPADPEHTHCTSNPMGVASQDPLPPSSTRSWQIVISRSRCLKTATSTTCISSLQRSVFGSTRLPWLR